jgi:hypothetical protein
MKIVTTVLLSAVLYCGCMQASNPTRISTSAALQKGKPLRVLILPFQLDGNPDDRFTNSFSEMFSAALLDCGMTPVDLNTAILKAGLQGIPIDSVYSGSTLSRLSTAVNAEAFLQGTITYEFVPASSGTSPSTMEKYRNDSTKKSSVVITGESNYSKGSYYAQRAMSLRLIDIRSGDILMSAFLNSNPYRNDIVDMSEAVLLKLKQK